MMISMLLGYAIAFLGVGLFAQGWRQVHKARGENRLVTDGLYAYVRHPQYTGLFIALFGEGVVHWPTLFSIGLFPVIVLVYTWLARREERHMFEEFGKDYLTYKQQVPMFIPQWGQWRQLAAAARVKK
ncbi:methyltransferase family protein [Psychrobacter pacificensis]|uniref:methyltransferase family protein n=2 Tax=Psychrobacter TaxID=497 RepID=UPI001BAF955E